MDKKIFNIVMLNEPNVGDHLASPLDYFSFPIAVEKVSPKHLNAAILKDKFIIYGGGGLIHLPNPNYRGGRMGYLEEICKLSPWLVSWGVGHNIHSSKEIKYHDYFIKAFRLQGVRDMRQPIAWVPCVSCMSKLFNYKYKIKEQIVVTGHDLGRYPQVKGFAQYDHNEGTVEEAIRFIASAQTVVTSAYHAAYWGMLLGKKVIVFNPYSTKFYGLPKEVQLATPDTWKEKLPIAKSSKGFLRKCRDTNKEYHKRVLKLVEQYIQQ